MGAYTCEYGIVHKVCRCPKPHTIKCDVPVEHGGVLHRPGKSDTYAPCFRMVAGLLGKHEDHRAHFWWYTSEGGGHYLWDEPTEREAERYSVKKWICPGNLVE